MCACLKVIDKAEHGAGPTAENLFVFLSQPASQVQTAKRIHLFRKEENRTICEAADSLTDLPLASSQQETTHGDLVQHNIAESSKASKR